MRGGMRSDAFWRLVIGVGLAAGLGSCAPSTAFLDCSGAGEVAGEFADINSGALRFQHGLAWINADGTYDVLFSDDAALLTALRASPYPGHEAQQVGEMLGAFLVGFRFAADGGYTERFTVGTSQSRGWSGADRGHIEVDEAGCARGYASLDADDWGKFALPLQRPAAIGALLEQGVEAGAVDRGDAATDDAPVAESGLLLEEDALARWRLLHARLHALHPIEAMQALGLSWPLAEQLAGEPRAVAALQRVRGQCPDADHAELDEYGDVVGVAEPRPGVRLQATVQTFLADDGEVMLHTCYVTARNGQSVEQCWPLSADCSL